MKFGKKFEYYKIPEWAEHYFDYYSLKTLLKFIDNHRSKKRGLKKLKTLKRRLSQEGLIEKKKNHPNTISEMEFLEIPKQQERSQPNISRKNFKEFGPRIKYINSKLKKAKTQKNNISEDSDTTTIYLEDKNPQKKREILQIIEEMKGLNDTQKKEYFKNFYESKVELIDKFFSWKLSDYQQYFLNTKLKMEQLKENNKKIKEENKSENSEVDNYQNRERDEFDYATSWKRVLSSLYNFTSWLHSYHNINILAIKKIQKKTKKIFDAIYLNNIDKELLDIDKKFKFFGMLPQIIELRKKVKHLYADEFFEGNIKEAQKELRIRLRGEKNLSNKFMTWFYYGSLIFSVLFFLFLSLNKKQKHYKLNPFLPAFNFSFIIIFTMFGISINLLILQHFGINYLYIFESESNYRIGFSQVFEISLFLLLIWCLLFIGQLITLKYTAFGTNFFLFPLIEIIFLLIFFLFPFKIFYRHFRFGIILCYLKTFIPFGKKGVLFKNFICADCLTSFIIPLTSLSLSICMFFNKDCRYKNIRINKCSRDNLPSFILIIYPFFIRVVQIINRMIYADNFCFYFINMIKYLLSISFWTFNWLKFNYDKEVFNILKITFGILQSFYQFFWDLYIDWGLGRLSSYNCFLRDKLIYPKWFYFFSIIFNLIIRFNWTLLLIKSNGIEEEISNFIYCLSEVSRKVIWCIIRIENEGTNNPEDYREILAVPELQDY